MLEEFLENFKSLTISSIDENNNPFTSYAPFIKNDGKYYVYLSDMARHARNLKDNFKASVFFIEDEKQCENIFARKRVVFQCKVNLIKRDKDIFETLMNDFETKHGSLIKSLKQMQDFNLFELSPFHGEAIFGFGKAYDIGGDKFDTLKERKNLKGHKSK